MLKWFTRNRISLLRLTYTIPIIFAVIVSINHVIIWYSIGNPLTWSVYLSVSIEAAALITLVALIFGKLGINIILPFIVITLIQFIGNIFYSYAFMDITSNTFILWKDFITTIFTNVTDVNITRFWLAVLEGASAPLLSLFSLNILINFEEKLRKDKNNIIKDIIIKNDIRDSIVEDDIKDSIVENDIKDSIVKNDINYDNKKNLIKTLQNKKL
jgi:hypothetical protein